MAQFTFTDEEKERLERLGVEAVVLFGSHAEGLAGPLSDIDLGVLIQDTSVFKTGNYGKKAELYNALYDIFSSLAGRTIQRLCNIDIVFLQSDNVNLQLKFHVSKHGVALFEKEPHAFPAFKEYVMERYADFSPLRKIFNEGILAQI